MSKVAPSRALPSIASEIEWADEWQTKVDRPAESARRAVVRNEIYRTFAKGPEATLDVVMELLRWVDRSKTVGEFQLWRRLRT